MTSKSSTRRRMGLLFYCASCFVAAAFAFVSGAYGFSPKPGSPLSERAHPRLHVTEKSIAMLAETIGSQYRSEYQHYVHWAASQDDHHKSNILSEARHYPLRALMVHQAFIAAVGQVPGISYPISLREYAGRAIAQMIHRLKAGDSLSYAAALVYDWTFNYMNGVERAEISDLIRSRRVTHKLFNHSLANPSIQPDEMFSSKYFEGCYAWYIALAFWGDGLIDKEAGNALATFHDTMLNYGYLDAQNFVSGNEGGWAEWIGYSTWHPRTHLLLVDAWRTATGEDFVAGKGTINGNSIANYPKFMAYAMDPHRYWGSVFSYVRMGGAQTTDTVLDGQMREQMYLLPRILLESGLVEEGALLRHLIKKYEVKWPEDKPAFLWGFLGVHPKTQRLSPKELGFPHSLWSRNLGVFIARTGFESSADGVFSVTDGHFRFEGHSGPDDWPGFSLSKFGPLVNSRCTSHRGYGNLSDYPGARRWSTVYFAGGHERGRKSIAGPSDLKEAAEGADDFDHGGIEQVTAKDGHFYHVRVDRSRQFQGGVRHSREYVWLPGGNPETDSDFLVVYDRTSAPSDPEWVYHVPWRPSASNYSDKEDLSTGKGTTDRIGESYRGKGIVIKELNGTGGDYDDEKGRKSYSGGAGSHGVLFCKTLLPEEARVEVTRVAGFDKDVLKRQKRLAIKSHRWQVSVKPTQSGSAHRFLNVLQSADAEKRKEMARTSLLATDTNFQGAFIEREESGRPNYIIIFFKEDDPHRGPITYSIRGKGHTQHLIVGILPEKDYFIEDRRLSNTSSTLRPSQKNIEIWDYKRIGPSTVRGVLYFESLLEGEHTFHVKPLEQS